MKIVVVNINAAFKDVEDFCNQKFGLGINFISSKDKLTTDVLKAIDPSYVFFLHWSYLIPEEVFSQFECIVFHMTDLPYGRGGSPLQNLIVQGHKSTKLSAIKVEDGIDTGDVYLKKDLDLSGTASEIFQRAGVLMKEMIVEIIEQNILPKKQEGEVVLFKRRKPEEGNIAHLQSAESVYDYIRMLDAVGYPHAFLETENFRIEFANANLESKDIINAHVRIIKK